MRCLVSLRSSAAQWLNRIESLRLARPGTSNQGMDPLLPLAFLRSPVKSRRPSRSSLLPKFEPPAALFVVEP